MTYTAREISKIYNINPKTVYIAAKKHKIVEAPNTSPTQYTRKSVEAYWGYRLNEHLNADLEKVAKVIQDHEERLARLENERT